jgi:ATP-dependent Lon protease
MSSSIDPPLPADFGGPVRLFPLPNLVVFPHALQPLHIYESRYRCMLEDALAGDQLLAMALLQPGWETDYEGCPAIFPVTCVGRVVSHTRLEDDRYNILLMGLKRASVVRELTTDSPYRLAEVQLRDDVYSNSASAERAGLQEQLIHRFRQLVPASAFTHHLVGKLREHEVPLGVLTDIVAFAVPFDVPFKHTLLREWSVDLRAKMLLEHLSTLVEQGDDTRFPFPPEFSEN